MSCNTFDLTVRRGETSRLANSNRSGDSIRLSQTVQAYVAMSQNLSASQSPLPTFSERAGSREKVKSYRHLSSWVIVRNLFAAVFPCGRREGVRKLRGRWCPAHLRSKHLLTLQLSDMSPSDENLSPSGWDFGPLGEKLSLCLAFSN